MLGIQMDKQPKGWIQPAEQAFIWPLAMPASQLLDEPSPAHQSDKQTGDTARNRKLKELKFG